MAAALLPPPLRPAHGSHPEQVPPARAMLLIPTGLATDRQASCAYQYPAGLRAEGGFVELNCEVDEKWLKHRLLNTPKVLKVTQSTNFPGVGGTKTGKGHAMLFHWRVEVRGWSPVFHFEVTNNGHLKK